jgi:ribosome-associated toxin RatA of RatAB toxin-antitoxin module
MRTVHRSAEVPFSAAQMFALVDDVEAYPEFLPWCRAAAVVQLESDLKDARLDIGIAGLHKHFTTRNRASPPHEIDIALIEGPFRSLSGRWRFEDLATGGCKIEVLLRFEVVGAPLGFVFATVFEEIARTQVNAFIARARQLYGS